MTLCPNCGNSNVSESHFCRFCGNPMPQQQQDFNAPAPRPYMWKTDEYQTQSEARLGSSSTAKPTRPDIEIRSTSPAQHPAAPMFSRTYRCPHCMSQFLPRIERLISTAGWIVFAVLLVFFFPLFWIGLLIREDVHVCPSCRVKIK